MVFVLPPHRTPCLGHAKRDREAKRDTRLAIWVDEPPEADRVPFMDAKIGECRWPYGDGHTMDVCAQGTVSGTSWCAYHLRRVMPPVAAEALVRGRLDRKANGYAPRDEADDDVDDAPDEGPPELDGFEL